MMEVKGGGGEQREVDTEVERSGERRGAGMECVDLHVSWPSVAGASLALDKSESVSRLDMRSSSAWTSLRPSFEPKKDIY